MKRLATFLLLCVGISQIPLSAQTRSLSEMKQAARTALLSTDGAEVKQRGLSADEIVEFVQMEKLSVMGYASGGMVVVSNDEAYDAVLGVTNARFDGTLPCGMEWWLGAINESMQHGKESSQEVKTRDLTGSSAALRTAVKSSVAPLLTTEWHQNAPFNNLCKAKIGGTEYTFVTGCVATAMAQVLRYHHHSSNGIGTFSYTQTINNEDVVMSADYEASTYQWDKMKDSYSGSYSAAEAEAVAQLVHDCGVSVRMDYGVSGSSSSQSRVPAALRNHFGFNGMTRELRRTGFSDATWTQIIKSELSEGRPVIYGGQDNTKGGHSFIIHGYNTDGLFYVNWGWGGYCDGYFNLDALNPPSSEGYQFNYNQEMTIICPEEPSNLVTKEVTLTSAGTLSSKISASEKYKVNKLKVTGPMNGTDMLFLRQMAGFDSDYGTFTEGLLSDIDLSDATVVNGGSSHISYNGTAYPTQSKMVPYALFLYSYPVANISSFKMPKTTTNIGFAAFFTCYNLPEMVIPSSVTQIGSQAFENCDGLRKLVCLSSTPPTILSSTFGDVDKKYCKLFVPMGRKSQYQSAANWSLFENIYEIGDVNTDGTPDVSDVVALISYITGNSRSTNSYYDINGDGVTDVSDVVALISSIVG